MIDYGVGNLGSVLKAFKYLDIPVILTDNCREIRKAEGVVLPGVGAFGTGMKNLIDFNLKQTLIEVIKEGKPFLGICLGLQLLFTCSEENPEIEGLDVIKGQVKKFELEKVNKIPHMGWNQVKLKKNDDPLFKDLSQKQNFYFVHSYFVEPEDLQVILGETEYGSHQFVSVIQKNNLWGLQCHPEKSSENGLKVLKNFSEVVFNGYRNNSGS